MEYHFLKDDAMKYGIEKAILLYNIRFWIRKNKANGRNFIEGHYWTYNSYPSFVKLFPFWNIQKIGRLLRELEEEGIIKSSNFNELKSDRSKWYCIIDESFMSDIEEESLESTHSSDLNYDNSNLNDGSSKMNDASFKNELSIYTYNKPDIKTSYKKEIIKEKRFVKPTIEEIKAYCNEKGINIDVERFYYYHDARGWMMGKYKMKNWKSAIRTWERNSQTKGNSANEFLELGRK